MAVSRLEQRMQAAIAEHRIWIDTEAEPYQRVRSWCQSSLELNWDDEQMVHRLVTWLAEHKGCSHGDSCRE